MVDVIDLGIRLNYLLNEQTRLGSPQPSDTEQGLILPDQSTPGSGMIAIIGEPGSGKSTLSLQIAAAAAEQGFDSAYISLEEEIDRLMKKVRIFKWNPHLVEIEEPSFQPESIAPAGHPPEPDVNWLKGLLMNRRKFKPDHGSILLPGLLPRPLSKGEERLKNFYWDQYRQIEFLVKSAAGHLNTPGKSDKTGIRLIIIDSINMLGVQPQNREMVHRLFDLFRRNNIMGIFTVEANGDIAFDSTMADVVFNFSRDVDSGYEITLLECRKSRFYKRTKGVHPYKIKAADADNPVNVKSGEIGIVVFPSPHSVVAATEVKKIGENSKEPSVPDKIKPAGNGSSAAEQSANSATPADERFPFGWGDSITDHLLRRDLHRGQVVAIAGPSGTFKTQIAKNFLLHGIFSGESTLYLRLRTPEGWNSNIVPYLEKDLGSAKDSHAFYARVGDELTAKDADIAKVRDDIAKTNREHASLPRTAAGKSRRATKIAELEGKAVELNARLAKLEGERRSALETAIRAKIFMKLQLGAENLLDAVDENVELRRQLDRINSPTKVRIEVLHRREDRKHFFVIADFPTGMLLPEEFIDITRRIRDAFDSCKIDKPKRVVLDDVAAIGFSYPLLKYSKTTGNLFLSAFVHFMSNINADLILIGTTGDLPESNYMVNQASSLADALLRTSIGTVFGDKYVWIAGDGMSAKQPNVGDNPPVVLSPRDIPDTPPGKPARYLKPDPELLNEFVGFDTNRIQRPGIALHLFFGNDNHRDYNDGLLERLQDRYGYPPAATKAVQRKSTGVQLFPFSSGWMRRLGPSAGRPYQERPRDHTAIRMVDEYEGGREWSNRGGRTELKLPSYSRNVLLIAYRHDFFEEVRAAPLAAKRWQDIRTIVRKLEPGIAAGRNWNPAPVRRTFAYDRTAPETLACLLLDAIGAVKTDWRVGPEPGEPDRFPESFTWKEKQAISVEFRALRELMVRHSWTKEELGDASRWPLKKEDSVLPADAAVYVCWYSQLRELLRCNNSLVQRMRICALPARGFKGDWYLRVEPGSVSLRLGNSIVDDLCSPREDLERFRQGFSLPVTQTTVESRFLAWPGARKDELLCDKDNPAASLFSIWENARRRSRIDGYDQFNRLLYGIGELIAGHRRSVGNDDTKIDFDDLVNRLPHLISALTAESPMPPKTRRIRPKRNSLRLRGSA